MTIGSNLRYHQAHLGLLGSFFFGGVFPVVEKLGFGTCFAKELGDFLFLVLP